MGKSELVKDNVLSAEFYEHLQMAIENILSGESQEETYDWQFEDTIGFKAERISDTCPQIEITRW